MKGEALRRALDGHKARRTLQLWRAVEAQHVVSTRVLVDTLDEQAELERLLDAAKPAIEHPPALHWLLYTPFRYPPLPSGSRFRGPAEPGAETAATAVQVPVYESLQDDEVERVGRLVREQVGRLSRDGAAA